MVLLRMPGTESRLRGVQHGRPSCVEKQKKNRASVEASVRQVESKVRLLALAVVSP